jgi:glycosyltransferase involved in cell wall biosynthesis
MDRPLVSVIVPVYNGECFLAEALDSILSQDYRPLEVIVVDDGSVDGTAEIARSFKGVGYIYQTNQGHGAAKNAGIAAASGEFIAFLDADDLWVANKLSVQMAHILKHADVGYVIARMRTFLEPGTEWPSWLNEEHHSKDPIGYVLGAMVARRTVFEQIGTFDTSYRHSNDSDWFYRARDAGIPMAILPDVLLYRRIHGSNMSHETEAVASELLRVVRSSVERRRKQDSAEGQEWQ